MTEEQREQEKKNPVHPMMALAGQMEDRDAKIAQYRLKKQIEANLDMLKNYQDEERKRKFYLTQIEFSILQTFENLALTTMEMNVLEHRAGLTPLEHANNERKSAPVDRKNMPPLKVMHIGPDDIAKMPYLMSGGAGGESSDPMAQASQPVV